ncbi:MAG: hypothetical protein OWS74_00755 [Firmicutes bacterium]|nr:hypothetical protein [Bacillota bacterium]
MAAEGWQERAFQQWKKTIKQSAAVRQGWEALERMDSVEAIRWMLRWQTGPSPAAKAVAQWLWPAPWQWVMVPAEQWDVWTGEALVLCAYPAPLGDDVLALAAARLVQAAALPEQLAEALQQLGPAVVPALWSAQYRPAWLGAVLPSYRRAYPELEDFLHQPAVEEFLQGDADTPPALNQVDWPDFPVYEDYRDQLEAGLVPHDGRGKSPASVTAVLMALHAARGDRLLHAGLAFKALDGRQLTERWTAAQEKGIGAWL